MSDDDVKSEEFKASGSDLQSLKICEIFVVFLEVGDYCKTSREA